MDMSLLKTLFYGLISGITEILPVSSHAHRLLILKIFGENREPELLGFLIDLAVLAALYVGCQTNIVRIARARRLAGFQNHAASGPWIPRVSWIFGCFKPC